MPGSDTVAMLGSKNMRAVADVGFTDVARTVLATRGEHLALVRARYSGGDERTEPFEIVVLHVVEIDAHELVAAVVTFDTGDIDAAFEELDARYLAGEAAAYSQTWSALTRAYAATNAHELPPTTPNWVNIDHRHGPTFAPGEFGEYVRAAWGLAQTGRVYIDEVHRLNKAGAVVTHTAQGTSKEGFDAEWREVMLIAFEDESVCRCELFDESDVRRRAYKIRRAQPSYAAARERGEPDVRPLQRTPGRS